MIAPEDEDTEPSWLDTEKDRIHRKEVEPLLFGTGKLSLNDPDENDDDDPNPFSEKPSHQNDIEQNDDASETARTVGSSKSKTSQSSKSKKQDYGSTDSSRNSFWTIPTDATSPVKKEGNSNDDDANNTRNNSTPKNAHTEEDRSDAIDQSGRPDQPKRNYCAKIFSAIAAYALITNLTLIVSQVLPMFWVPLEELNPRYLALKVYMCIFAMIFIVVEVGNDKVPFFKDAVFLTTYSTRGFLYTFFGLVCFELSHADQTDKMVEEADIPWFALVDIIAAWALISLGIIYFLMGIFCLQNIRNRWVAEERQVWKNYREAVKSWENERG